MSESNGSSPAAPISKEQIAEWRTLKDDGMISAVGEYTPGEFWTLLDAYESLLQSPPANPLILNLNDTMEVKLTKFGADIWNQSFECIPSNARPRLRVEGEFLSTQLWSLMQTFGPHIHLGMVEVPFESNVIRPLPYKR